LFEECEHGILMPDKSAISLICKEKRVRNITSSAREF